MTAVVCDCKNGFKIKSRRRFIEGHWVEYLPQSRLILIEKSQSFIQVE